MVERLSTLPPLERINIILQLLQFALLPKTHHHAHTLTCKNSLAIHRGPGESGQTDGEGIERPWSWSSMGERHRDAIKASGEVSEEHAAAVKNAHANYRAKHREHLAFKQRLRRQKAYIAKYGEQAYRDRIAGEQARADAAWEANLAKLKRKEGSSGQSSG
ncbi:hypothetical protein B0H12DRAFT_1244102 [Mycena haematopus]|nr:hypothetical protein B0H12DRAFT_1244102 [Mycena haematopus]